MKVLQSYLSALVWAMISLTVVAQEATDTAPMQGVPPARDSQVTMKNYTQYPANRWAFRNAGAPLNVVMIPREGQIVSLGRPARSHLGQFKVADLDNKQVGFDAAFAASYADAVAVVQGNQLLHETYFGDFSPHAHGV